MYFHIVTLALYLPRKNSEIRGLLKNIKQSLKTTSFQCVSSDPVSEISNEQIFRKLKNVNFGPKNDRFTLLLRILEIILKNLKHSF